MEYDENVFSSQYPIVKRYAYHYVIYKQLISIYHDFKIKSEFWSLTIDSHILQAVILWCIVFGSESNNITHWKKLSKNNEEMKKDFKEGLLKKLNLTSEGWENYWKEILDFRNNFAAHRTLDYNKPVPFLDNTYRIALYYDEWIRKIILPDQFEEPPLEESCNIFKEKINLFAKNILLTTESFEKNITNSNKF